MSGCGRSCAGICPGFRLQGAGEEVAAPPTPAEAATTAELPAASCIHFSIYPRPRRARRSRPTGGRPPAGMPVAPCGRLSTCRSGARAARSGPCRSLRRPMPCTKLSADLRPLPFPLPFNIQNPQASHWHPEQEPRQRATSMRQGPQAGKGHCANEDMVLPHTSMAGQPDAPTLEGLRPWAGSVPSPPEPPARARRNATGVRKASRAPAIRPAPATQTQRRNQGSNGGGGGSSGSRQRA